MNNSANPLPSSSFLTGTGEMATLIRHKDWSLTPLGAIEYWPQSLKTTVSLCLASNFPINIIWGPEHTQIYNDGYLAVCGASHPQALGEPYTVTWASAWPAIGEPFANALAGNTSFLENQRMFLSRNGYLEETFFTFSTSPIRDESGGIGGLFHPVTETTSAMLSERRTRALRDLNVALADVRSVSAIAEHALEALHPFAFDLPFLAVYEWAEQETAFNLRGQTGLSDAQSVFPASVTMADSPTFPFNDSSFGSASLTVKEGFRSRLDAAPCGPYEEPPDQFCLLPVRVPGVERPLAVIVAGVSPRLPLDDGYSDFLSLLNATLAAGYANAKTYEEERLRAEALAALDQAKITFFSNVSHEFRTPLTLMLGPLEDALLQAQDMPQRQRELLTVAHRNALRLLKLVNSLLDFARLESGRTEANFQPTDLAQFTADLASNFRSACERAGLDLVIRCPALSQPVFVDREMWEKVVLNLISNAFKFTFHGAITVEIAERDHQAILTVSDTGVGIAQDQQALVFQRFHRIENQQGRTFEGTGIGLALVDELIKLHKGNIDVFSQVGTGTRFEVCLPMGAAHLPHDRIDVQRLLPSTEVRSQAYVEEAMRWLPDELESGHHALPLPPLNGLPQARILLADDNADMRAYIARILSAGGYEVELADNGLKAWEAINRQIPDLILSDVMMPGMDGFALLQAVRDNPSTHDSVFMLLSARAGEEARVEGLSAGADDYLVKPFNARELRARVDAAITLRKQRNEAQARERALLEAGSHEREALLVQLHQMQKMESIGQLTGGVAHDFNNLLTPIFASIELLKRRLKGDERAIRLADAGLQSAERAKVLVSRLLAFARKQLLEVRPTDLKQLIPGMKELLESSIDRNIELSFVIEPVSRIAHVDVNQIELALLNLALNARDAMPSGGKLELRLGETCIDASGHPNLPPGQYLKISITDNGVGMDEHTRARAVEPFFTTKGNKGTGLGLSMVHGLVAQMGGVMQIHSALGQGTRIDILLPSVEAGSVAHAEATIAVDGVNSVHSVLVVDDEELVRMTVVELLIDEGYALTEAASGERALELIRSGLKPDLLLTDFMMQGINGSELANQARALIADLPVVVMTGYADLKIDWPTLGKPFSGDELTDAVRERLSGAQGG